MTQEDKELLLKDLCARLPYGVKVSILNEVGVEKDVELSLSNIPYIQMMIIDYLKNYKPYLFPLSSMTDEQKRDYQYITERWMNDPTYTIGDSFDWLNKNHFDYRGLIPKGLAIDATGLNIY